MRDATKFGAETTAREVASYALDPQNAERLWGVSETLVDQRIPLRA